MIQNKKTQTVGLAGTYFVAAELSQQGHIATVTSRNAEGLDILASRPDGSKVVSIQIKTSGAEQRASFTRSWFLSKKDENRFSKSFFYVFVDLQLNSKPDYYIVPSKIVSDYIRESHKKHLSTPGRGGKQHKDTTMRFFEIYDDSVAAKYLNKWENLGL